MTKNKCRVCKETVTLRKNDIVWKLDKNKKSKKEQIHPYKIVEQKNGMFKLELITEEKQPKEEREKLANEIVQMIEPQLKEQVGAMVKKSLALYDVEQILPIKKEIEKGKIPKLDSKPGCVFIQISKEKIFL
jgi:hypothetical protein